MSDNYVSAAEVCRLLGVTRPTIYSYVSRGKLRSSRVPGTRERQYWMPDVSRLLHGDVGQPAVPPVPSTETRITMITPNGPYYRGRSAIELADTATLEEVAAILWGVPQQLAFGTLELLVSPIYKQISALLDGFGEVDRATALFPPLERADPRAYDLTKTGMARTGGDVVRWLAAIILGRAAASEKPLHVAFSIPLRLGAERTDLVRRMLVLAADNGFESGTMAVRAVASTGVTPWRAVLAGLSVTTGRSSRSRHYGDVARFVQLAIHSEQPGRLIVQRLQDGEELPGFTSRPYPAGDPRGRALLSACAAIYPADPEFRRLQEAVAAVETVTGLQPSFALANCFARHKLGLAHNNAPFVIGRACGWIAHAIEQYEAGEVERGVVNYRGPLPSADITHRPG